MFKSILVLFAFVLFSSTVFADTQTCRINGNFAGVKSHSEWMSKSAAVIKKTAAQKQYPGVRYALACKNINLPKIGGWISARTTGVWMGDSSHLEQEQYERLNNAWMSESPVGVRISGPATRYIEWDKK